MGALVEETHLRPGARRHLQPPLQEAARRAAGLFFQGSSLEGRAGDVRQAHHLAAGGQRRAVDRIAHRVLRAAQRRPETRPPQQRGVLRAQGPRPRRARRPLHEMGSRRRHAGRERLRAPALQRRREGILHPPGVQGQAVVPVHAPSVPEDGRVADRQAAARRQGIPSADGNLSAEGIMTLFEDKQAALSGDNTSAFLAEAMVESEKFRTDYATLPSVIKAKDMPWERSPDGLIKHLVNQKMHTRECCIEAYMQFLKDGEQSGKHRHMWEELFFVVEGSGYDLHWDLKWVPLEAFDWQWAEAPKKFEWTVGDYVYIPPFTMHQHFANAGQECRIIVMSNRIVKDMGFDWYDQVERAPGF